MAPKVREVIERLEQEGWVRVRTKGSHRQYRHPTKSGKVTVPGKSGSDLPPGTWISIQRQAGWRG